MSLRKILIASSVCLLMGLSLFLSLWKIDRPSLWLDEYWCLYLSTGRGDSVLAAPHGVIMDAPAVWFDHSTPFWRIWNGLHSTIHPPLGYLALRAWVGLFGDSDFAARSQSAIFSALSVGLLFVLLLRSHGIQTASLAAAAMAIAVSQTDYAQMIRPYCLGNFLSLCCIAFLLHIRNGRLTFGRLFLLGFICLLMMLTHYYCAGPIAAFAIYVYLAFPQEKRKPILIAMVLAVVIFSGIWFPFMPFPPTGIPTDMRYPGISGLLYSFIQTPYQILMGHFYNSTALVILLALMAFVLPAFNLRKPKETQLWWLCATIPLCVVTAVDLITISTRAPTLSLPRYELFALPGICAGIAVTAKRFVKWLVPLAGLAALPILNPGTGWLIAHAPSSLMEHSLMIIMALIVIGLLAVAFSRPRLSRWLWAHSEGGSGWVWLWFAGVLFFLTWFDFYSRLAVDSRIAAYAIFVVFIILVILTPADHRLASTAACVLFFCLGCAALGRFVQGPAAEPDWRTTTQIIQQSVARGDLLIFDDPGLTGPNFEYILYQHYAHDDLSHKIALIGKPTNMSAMHYSGNIWLISFDPPRDMQANFPGWHIVRESKFADVAHVLNIASESAGK